MRTDGHEVLYVAEFMPSVDDDRVLGLARQHSAVLITADKDFGELVVRLGRASFGVVLLRVAGLTAMEKAELSSRVLAMHADELPGAFTVVSKKAIRIRAPRPDR